MAHQGLHGWKGAILLQPPGPPAGSGLRLQRDSRPASVLSYPLLRCCGGGQLMTPQQVAALGPAFAAYLRPFEDCFGQDRTRNTCIRIAGACSPTCPERASNPSPWRRERPSAPCRSSSRTTSGIDWPRATAAAPPRRRRPGGRAGRRPGHGRSARRDLRGQEGQEDAGRAAAILRGGRQAGELHRQRASRRGPGRLQGPARRRPVLAPIVVEGPAALPGGRHPRRRGVPAQVASGPGADLPGGRWATASSWTG